MEVRNLFCLKKKYKHFKAEDFAASLLGWLIFCDMENLMSGQDLVLPAVAWLSGLFNPQSFLTDKQWCL